MSFPVTSVQGNPPLDTHKALLLLDLQNDFVSDDGKLPVSNTAPFVKQLPDLVASFREKGDVVWVRTEFQSARSTFSSDSGNYAIVLKQFLPPDKAIEEEKEDVEPVDLVNQPGNPTEAERRPPASVEAPLPDPEAFLAPVLDISIPRCCLPHTRGSEYPPSLLESIDHQKDLNLVKSQYSAFADTSLLLQLRMRRVTELYICGSLSNVSVYATVMDAVRHGLEVILVEDCLGYRSERCHFEAVRQMADSMGANGIDYQELMDDLAGLLGDVIQEADFTTRYQVSLPIGPAAGPPRRRGVGNNDYLSRMDGRSTKSSTPSSDIIKTPSTLAGEVVSLSRESLILSESSSAVSIKRFTPEPSPPRKRSTSDLGEVDDDRVPKLVQRPSIRRASHDAYSSERPKQRQNKPRIRMQRPSQDASAPPPPPPPTLGALGQSYSTGDIPNNVEMTSDSDIGLPPPVVDVGDQDSTVMKPNKRRKKRVVVAQELGPGDTIAHGDSQLMLDVLPAADAEKAFVQLKSSVKWQKMFHRSGEVPRLVAVQGGSGELDNGLPIYRHPADESPELLPFDSTVTLLKSSAENLVGHPLNHVLIQWYRSGEDNISEHSDKSLDIVKDSKIVNMSLGARRTMTLRTKKPMSPLEQSVLPRTSQRIPLPHNSLFVLGPTTNQYWLHGIRPDKRPLVEKHAEELAFEGERISLTFRHIGTFIDPVSKIIWGQGATGKTKDLAGRILEGGDAEVQGDAMIQAFGNENHQSDTWNWDEWYGRGFDVVNFVTKQG